jgi:peptidoglycan hydrolase-like protein with peptidoglycan-binding domain
MKGIGLAVVAGLGALMFAGGSSADGGGGGGPAPKPPKGRPSEETPPEITGRIAAAVATLDPKKMRAEAAKLRKEGWDREAASLEATADQLEHKQETEGEREQPIQTPTNPTPAPVTPAPGPTAPRVLSQGMKGEDVKAWQRQLIADGYTHLAADGIFGPLTVEATKTWQAERGLKADGIVGPATRAAIGSKPIASVVKTPPAPTAATSTRVLSQGMKGEDVKAWQRQLIADGYKHIAADGIFGPLTVEATKTWQAERGLKADGIVGPATRAAIGKPVIASVPGGAASRPAPAPAVAQPAPSAPPLPFPGPVAAPRPAAVPLSTGKGAAPALTTSSAPRLLKLGVSGDDVRAWQTQLIKDGFAVAVDGIFGEKTQAATKAWQTSRGVSADGVVGPKTRAEIGKPAKASPKAAAAPAAPVLTVDTSKWRTLKQGMTGSDVKEWQLVLNKYGSIVVATDGNFGPKTHEATVAFQRANKLDADGIVGKGTRAKLDQLAGFPNIAAGDLEMAPVDIHEPPPFLLGPEESEPPPSSSPPPEEDASAEQLARSLVRHLEQATPGHEDRELVRRFQRANGLNDTGVYGPGTAEAIASLGLVPPRPFEWPSKKTFKVKARYKATMREHARRDPDRASAWAHASNV